MILAFVRNGDHSKRGYTDTLNNAQIKLWFKQNGYPFNELITKVRKWGEIVPFVENLIHSTWHVNGGQASIVNTKTDEVLTSINGAGLLIDSDYQAKFETASRHKEQAIQRCDVEELYSAIAKGIASIESYFNYKANDYNRSADNPLIDNKQSPVSLEDKFRKWVPVLSEREFDFSKNNWRVFKELLEIRHDEAIHPKKTANAITYIEIAEIVNKFRDGLAITFYELHIILGDDLKRTLIRECFYPDVYVE
jgi:hypothetical protein